MEAWTQFFVRAGIPSEIAKKYAKSFATNRITKEMLPELDKSTLSELGVSAIGDQLCILRRIKAAKSAIEREAEEAIQEEPQSKPAANKARITAPGALLASSSSSSEHRRGKPPPDRHEIYHVKMPDGNTHRTRQILQKAEVMRQQGLAVRGTTGVRQGGRSVSPIDKSSLAARMKRKDAPEVTSSTDRRHISSKISRISQSGIKKTISNRPPLNSRLTQSPAAATSSLRIHVGPNGRSKASRMDGRLQKVSTAASSSDVLLIDDNMDYEDDEIVEEVVDYEEDEMGYSDAPIYDVVDAPVRQRISYSSGRLSSTVQRAPPRASAPSSSSRSAHHHHQPRHHRHDTSSRGGAPSSSSSNVFNRLSFNSR
ncbi:SAM domain-containing protein [Caenorhabditis elegans]|uniref:SAM domain-containing protein n=1 Tax=Caenorhabditis elegans TaxID=6239 RepID=O62258_CAEEL|nr:SAM domain-containing protein [Caenorhabditis elegans]CAB04458.1 SAM domain-containing protein [Caenorhabditis elegans]|eukprot:NP_507998.1 Uncharacterized protein CELE_F53F8.5 [Caenorhabditis elegans]